MDKHPFDSRDDEVWEIPGTERQSLNDAFRAAGSAYLNKIGDDRSARNDFLNTIAETFGVTSRTVRSWFAPSDSSSKRNFIPNKSNARPITDVAGSKLGFKMRVAFAKGLVLGQVPDLQVSPNQKATQRAMGSNSGGSSNTSPAKKLQDYLKNPFTRTQGIRIRPTPQGLIYYDYSRYPEYPPEEEGDIDNWETTYGDWNPEDYSDLNFG